MAAIKSESVCLGPGAGSELINCIIRSLIVRRKNQQFNKKWHLLLQYSQMQIKILKFIKYLIEKQTLCSRGNGGNQHRELVNSIKEMVQSSLDLPSLSSNECCIYKIPVYLLKLNEEAYTPRVISIGPFDHDNKRLETTEKLKLKYFKRFLQQIDFNVEILVNAIKQHKERVHCCYSEIIKKFRSDDFMKLILVDGIFIIELFHGICSQGISSVILENHTLLNPISWHAIMLDMQLLENQLPFFALEILFSPADVPVHPSIPSFTSLAIKVFENFRDEEFPRNLEVQPIRHFVDLAKAFLLPSSRKLLSPHESNDLARSVDHLYTASQLYEAGVKFKGSSSKSLFDRLAHRERGKQYL